ncbi:MAG TPA: tol-pal system protein YbgF [Hyphomonadaceae bacterium]|jgi:tol-pal system protein YbgF|nr:tol-pal system protein YbgF [Hyphomonadaceae bacterium]
MKARAIALTRSPVNEAVLALLAGFACLAAALAAAPQAHGQVLSSTPYIAPADPAVEALRNRVIQLESDLKAATDRSEKLGFDLAQVRKTAEDAKAAQAAAEQKYQELMSRVEKLEQIASGDTAALAAARAARPGEVTINAAAAQTGAVAVAPPVDLAALPQEEEPMYQASRGLLFDNDYASAEAAFGAFLKKYPKSKNAHEAQYMLGDALLYQNRYGEAVSAYEKLLNSYPNSSNGPMAMAKLGRSLRLMNKKTEACQVLALLPKQFPKASNQAKETAQSERERAGCK